MSLTRRKYKKVMSFMVWLMSNCKVTVGNFQIADEEEKFEEG